MNIPLAKPYWGREERRIIAEALKISGGSGDGPYTATMVSQLKTILNVPHILPVTSCTHGLELAVAVSGLKPGDEVIVPSFTLSSTANAVLVAGGTPVFADIDPRTYCLDPDDVERVLTAKTKGIIVVHYAGMPAPMEKLLALAQKHHLFVVEDAAHAIGATYRGKPLGTWGNAGAFSFHGTKNVCCGEGGVVATSDPSWAERMDIYRANGTNRSAFLARRVALYTWVGKGSSYFLSDLLASLMTVQLGKLDEINEKRSRIAEAYDRAFSRFGDTVLRPIVPEGTAPNWHIYALRFRTKDEADRFSEGMHGKGIAVSKHYVPLHSSPMGRELAGRAYRPLPVTEAVAETLVRLPIYAGLTRTDVRYITASARSLLKTLS